MSVARQVDLFTEFEQKTKTIEQAAKLTNVSTATIRNWLKTGYLKSAGKGTIYAESIDEFIATVAGKEKLTSRANKSLKDEHDHDNVSQNILARITDNDSDLGNIGHEYEALLSNAFRNKEGIYYTPEKIIADLFSSTDLNLETATFCDPCCGGGNFISQAIRLGFKPENIYGFDTDPVAIEITKKRIESESGYHSKNIISADFLNDVISNQRLFDCIYTNPPWGKKIDKKIREEIGKKLSAGKALDTCSLFFFACILSLKNGGELGLLLPEAFFNISNFEAARLKALDFQVKRLVDYEKPFKGLVTKAQAIVLKKSPLNPSDTISCGGIKNTSFRTAKSFLNNPKTILNLNCSDIESTIIDHVFSLPHITLRNQAKWGLGIVTGNNSKFCKSVMENGYMPVYKGSDIENAVIKPPSNYIPTDLSLYQQVAPKELYDAEEKLIYKFISSKLSFYHDTEKRSILNSANCLIPNKDFPISAKVLADLLSSNFMNWIFTKIFNTHKILRGDIECLPIHSQFLKDQDFCESKLLDRLGIMKNKWGAYRLKTQHS